MIHTVWNKFSAKRKWVAVQPGGFSEFGFAPAHKFDFGKTKPKQENRAHGFPTTPRRLHRRLIT